MEHQLHFEMPVNVDTLKPPTNQVIFPITTFYHFHKDANINYQLNRFLIPGLEDLFAEIGRQVENFDDWKKLFCTKAAAFEKEGNTDMQWDCTVPLNFLWALPTPTVPLLLKNFTFFLPIEGGKKS